MGDNGEDDGLRVVEPNEIVPFGGENPTGDEGVPGFEAIDTRVMLPAVRARVLDGYELVVEGCTVTFGTATYRPLAVEADASQA